MWTIYSGSTTGPQTNQRALWKRSDQRRSPCAWDYKQPSTQNPGLDTGTHPPLQLSHILYMQSTINDLISWGSCRVTYSTHTLPLSSSLSFALQYISRSLCLLVMGFDWLACAKIRFKVSESNLSLTLGTLPRVIWKDNFYVILNSVAYLIKPHS